MGSKTLRLALLGLLCVLLALLPLAGNYAIYVADLCLVWVVVALGLNLLVGAAGQISLGHGAFMAIGGYTAALLTLKLYIPFYLSLPAAALVSFVMGFLMGLPALRLSGHYLALATLSFGVAVPQILIKWEKLTSGSMGLSPGKPDFGFYQLQSDHQIYVLLLVILALLVWGAYNLLHSKPGRALLALRESEISAQAMGINLALYKTLIFAISAAYAGIAGALMVGLVGFVVPFDFNIGVSFQVLAMVVVGGVENVIGGAAVGAVFLTLLPQIISLVSESAKLKSYSAVIQGGCIVLVILFLPKGLSSLGDAFRRRPPRSGPLAQEVKARASA